MAAPNSGASGGRGGWRISPGLAGHQQRQPAHCGDRQVDRQGVAQGDRLHQAAEIVAEEHQIG
ncbi:MAG: hypothetical protein ACO3ZD_10090, partial [Cyanobium sp.]